MDVMSPTPETLERLNGMPMRQLGPALTAIIHDAVRELITALAEGIAVACVLDERTGSDFADYEDAREGLWGPRPKPPEGSDGAEVTARA